MQARLADGRILNFPDGTDPSVIDAAVKKVIANPFSAYTEQELENAPRVKGTTGDIARETGQGVLGGIQSLTDLFGANNFASKYLQEKSQGLAAGLTPERQQELQIEQELSKRAEGDTFKEITTGLKNVLRHPFTSVASGLGSSVPLIAGTILAPEAAVGRAALGIGSLMGLGGQKGQNYQAVYDEAIRQNKTPQEAEALAQKAQEYSLQNAPGLAFGAGLGALEGAAGAGARIGKFFNPAQAVEGASRGIAAPTFGKALGKASLEGGGTEFLQGSGAQVAANMALSQAGFDTPLLQGAFGAGAHDALIGTLTGAAVSPMQLSNMKREYDQDQVKKLFEDNEKAAKEKEATQAKFNKEMGVKPEILALPAPAQEITEKPTDKLKNPLGNFTPEELGPERVNAIDEHRAANNKPPLKTYSIEDIVDAMPKTAPEAERAALNELVANKAGSTFGYSNQKVSAQDVLNAATQKGIDTDTQGFKDFLTRATGLPSIGTEEKAATAEAYKNKPLGLSELDMMTDAQRFVAQQSLLKLPTKEGETTILPTGTNATHYDQDQYLKALGAVDALHNKGKPATQAEALGEIKKSTGLTRDEDAQYLLRDAVRRGDFDLNENDEIVPAETATYLPEGHRIEETSLKEGEAPENYEVKAGDKVLSTAPTEAEAQAKLERYKAVREKDSADIDKEIAEKQKAVEKSNENVEKMEARGLGRTPEYQKASAAHANLVQQTNKEIGDLNRDKAELDSTQLTVKAGGIKPVKRKTFKLHKAKAGEAATQVGSYPTRQAAEQAITSNMSESELEDLAKDTRRRTLARRARQELNERRTEKIKVRREFKQVSGDIAKELESFLAKIGLKGVGLKLMSTLGGSEGEYAQRLIQIALDVKNPLGVLRHESIHALKDLGFFSDNQWNALRRMAKDKWIKQFMKDVPYSEGVSRYDAYKTKFDANPPAGVTFQEYIEEEAIADAFRYFHENGTPPGMIAAILKRLNQFFEALRNALNNGGFYTSDDIFEKIEKGELVSSKQGTGETKASLKTPLSTREIMEQNDQFAQAELGLNTEKVKGKTGVNNVRDIAKALNAQTVGEEGAMNRLSHTVKDEDRIAKAMADEVGYQLRATAKTGTGLGWYSNNYPNAVKMLSRRFPELENNKHARSVFSALVAVTSNGERVAKNIDNAIKLYSKLRDGKPLVAMGNRRASALDKNLINIENLLRKYGTDFEKELLKEITVKDMNAYLRSIGEESDASYLANTVIPSAAIHFGPKLGAFYANLSGSEGYLTMDLWWTRSINRMRGLLIPKATKASLDKFREMLDMPDASVNDLVEESIPLRNIYEENGFVTDLEFLAGGKEPAKKVLKEAWFKRAEAAAGDAYDQFLFEHNLLKMANTIYKNEFEMLEEAPFSATDRAFMYKAARKAQALLRGEGVDLTLADIQAALWYYEKRLYAKLSGRKADDIGYEEAIIKQANQGNRSVRPSVVFTGQQNGGNVSTGAVQLSGQPSSATVKASLKGIVAEVAPNPDQEVAARWRLMNSADKQQTTEVVARRVIPKLFDDMGFKGWSYNISSGRYEGEQNPNIIISAPDSATDEELNEFAKVIGNVFDQKAMVTYDEDNTTSDSQNGFVSVIIPNGMDDQTLTNLRDHIAKEVPEANADTVRDGKIHFGNFSKYTDNEISDEQYYNNIKDAIANFDYDGIIDVQKPIQFHSELIEPTNREEYLEGTRYGTDQGSREKAGGDDLWRQGRNRLEAVSEDAIKLRNNWIESRTKSSEGGRSGATTFPNVETEYGTPIENASSAVGVHFSKQKRGTIVSKFYGTGLKGLEGKRLSEPANKDIKDRIYFYVDKGKGIVPESGVGNAAHVVRLNNLYDTVKDPLKIIKNNKGETENDRASNLERNIKNAGFDGYVFMDPLQSQGYAVLVGDHNISVPPSRASLKAPETPAFKRFFGDSKITNENGEPMVMYHATNSDFNVFNRSDDGKLGEGIYSTSIPEYANEFAPKGNIMPLYVHAENPFVINVTRADKAPSERFSGDINKAMVKAVADFTDGKTRLMDLEGNQVRELFEKNGYDGIMVKDDQGNIVEANVFTPTQLKSAIGNTGTYSISNPNIRYSLASRLQTMPNSAAGEKRVNETTTTRDEVGHAQRMIQAIQGDTFSKIRQRFFNRYQRIGEFDKRVAKMKGVVKLLADTAAESAALMSDYANGVAYKALGFNGKGGVPEFKNQVVTVNQTTKGPVEIFATLAKFGDPKIYQYYQFWSGVQRGSRYIKNNNGVYEEKLFNQPADIQLAKDYEKAFPEFVQVQKEWIEYNNGLVKFLVDTGVLSAARANEFTKYSDYIPFYRQFDDETTIGPQLFQSMSAVKAPKRAKGGEAPLADFLETIVRNTQSSVQAGMKAVAAKRAIDNALLLGEAEQVTANERSKFDVIQVYDKGELKFYRVNDPLYLEAMKGLNLPEIPFLGILAKPADWLRTFVTKEPGFMLANMMKDSMQTYITSGSNMKPIIETAANFATALAGKNPTVERLKAAGLGGNAHFVGDIAKSGEDFAKMLRKQSGKQTTTEKALKPFTSLWDALGQGTEASDLATRAAVYDRVMAETQNEAEAIFQAVETMNFYRHGNSAIVRILTAVTPFLNARMQGLDVFYRAGFAPTVAKLTGRGDQVTQADLDKQKTFMIRSAGVVAMSVAYWALTHDDDEYKKQEQETRDNNWLIPALGIKIPIPFEVGFLFKVLPERIMEYTMGGDTGQDFAKSMYRGIEQTIGLQFPQAILPMLENSVNYSFFTQRAIVPPGLENVDPEFQVGPSTSNVAEMIGKSIGSSPMKVDHLIKGYTGTLGMYLVDVIDSVMDINSNVPKASKRFEQMPFIKRFALDPEARGTVSSYYELKNNVDQVVRTINLLEKNADFENLPQYAQDNAGLWATHDFVLSLDKQMKEYQQYATMIRNSGMDADEKRDALSAVHEAQNALTSNIQYIRKMISQQ